MPQILQNYSSKSTKGLSRILVALNLFGDILKLIYFLMKVFFLFNEESIISIRVVRNNSGDFRQFCCYSDFLL
jgi:hypothetical protein